MQFCLVKGLKCLLLHLTLVLLNPGFPCPLRKHAYFKYTENFATKKSNFLIKNSDILHISAQTIDCGYSLELPRRGGSNKYPQSMYSGKIKNNNVYPCKPQFYYIKVGFKGLKLYRHVFVMHCKQCRSRLVGF